MESILITPKDKAASKFLQRLLGELDSVKEIKTIKEAKSTKKEKPFAVLSESSLGKEWLSKEDDVWDDWAAAQMKKKK